MWNSKDHWVVSNGKGKGSQNGVALNEERKNLDSFVVEVVSSLICLMPASLETKLNLSHLKGITPIIQVLRGVINDPEDTDTMLWVLNANKTEADILLRAELEILSERAGSSRYRQHLVLSKADADWKHSKGRITKEMLKTHLPEPDDDALILICGPDPMINDLVKPGLTELGWDISTSLVVF